MKLDKGYIVQGLIERGFSPQLAEAVALNSGDESGFDTSINEAAPTVPGSRGGGGLLQWTGPRRVALENFAAQQGRPWDDPEVQLDFAAQERRGSEKAAYDRAEQAGSVGEAAAAVAREVLRPAKANLDRRVAAYTGGNWSEGGWSPEGNALRAPDYAGKVNALAASLDEQQMAQQQPQRMPWQGLDPAMFMLRRQL
jgi:hypothetical protein